MADEMDPVSSDRRTIVDAFLILALEYRRPDLNVGLKVELIDRDRGTRAICELAERENADLICVSATDRSGAAQEVLRMCRTAVLHVPETGDGKEPIEEGEGCCFWRGYDASLRGDRGSAETRER
jgi:hypothetical protein